MYNIVYLIVGGNGGELTEAAVAKESEAREAESRRGEGALRIPGSGNDHNRGAQL